jgi:flagellar hook-basal body complex protein FliE
MQYLKDAMKETNKLILDSEKLVNEFAAGRTDNIHQVLIAAEKADIALQFTMQIRNKIMDAYNEIMRMQV